jgi:ribosomal protein S18 acetylase RimI-like enzyme
MDWNNIIIREARLDEWNKIPRLHRDEGEEYMESSAARNKLRFERVKLGRRIVLFAEQQGKVLGAIQLQLFSSNPKIANGKTIAHLDDLVVDPDFRGQGIGKQLLQRAEEVLQEKGFVKVTLAVRHGEKHEGLCRFYDKRGYQFFYEKEDGTGTVFEKDI